MNKVLGYSDAMTSLRPGTQWRLNGSKLTFYEGELPAPTAQEIEAELARLQAAHVAPDPPRRLVPKSRVIERLHATAKLAAAKAALDADMYARERWYAADRPAIYADDPEALALLTAIGADPAAIMAPE